MSGDSLIIEPILDHGGTSEHVDLPGFMEGVKRRKDCITTESVVMRASTGTVRWVKGRHRPDHEPGLH